MTAHSQIFEPATALVDTVTALHAARVPYFVVGSFASGMRGEFRATNDIDFVVRLNPGSVESLIATLSPIFIHDPPAIREAVKAARSFNLIHEPTFIKVDLFTKIGELEAAEFGRATDVVVPSSEVAVKVSTAEYNILAKLRWYLASNRQFERQLRDVRGIILSNRETLDLELLKEWAGKMNLLELLEKALAAG